jgi:hypothetical protein
LSVVEAAAPRVLLSPEYGSSAGVEAIELAAMAGLELDPWQQLVLEHSLGEGEDGRWAAAEVGLCVPRQNGKNSVLEARELAGLFLLGEDLLIHSAHQFKTAKEHFLRVMMLIESTPDLDRRVKKVIRTHGEEGIELIGGQRLLFFARNKSSGRGFAQASFVAFDEAMFLPETTMGALLPAQSSSANRQRWYVGSAVDQAVHTDGVVFARIRKHGHDGTHPRLVWCEWSAEGENPVAVEDAAFSSEEVWARANPGLHIRVSVEAVEDELRALDRRTFAVERLGVGDWPDIDLDGHAIISQEDWEAIQVGAASQIVGAVCFAVDVSPERTAAVAVCGRNADGQLQVEIPMHKEGTGWVVEWLNDRDQTHNPTMIVLDSFGPAASLLPGLLEAGVNVTTMNSGDHTQACGMFVDAVQQQTVRHLGSLELRNAVKGAAVRPLNDAWAFSRKNSGVDISPLVAATFAHWAAATSGSDNDWAFYA